jgi:putative cardiolipin synthase
VARPVSLSYSDTHDSRIAQSRLLGNSSGLPGESGFKLLQNGIDAFVARAQLAANAEHGIDVQYYLYHDDLTASLLTAQLLKAADRGVRVRILVDDIEVDDRDFDAVALDHHNNVEVRVFNPFGRNVSRWSQFITRLGIVTRRMHNKSFTVDNQITIVGGRNIGDEYFDAHPDIAFSDLDVLAIGPVVQEVSHSFDEYWNSEVVYPVSSLVKDKPTDAEVAQLRHEFQQRIAEHQDSEYLDALRNSKFSDQIMSGTVRFHWGKAQAVFDRPEKVVNGKERKDLLLSTHISPWLEKPKQELIIFSPYFVPGKWGTRALTDLSKSGVRVRILTNSLASTDVAVVHGGYAKYRKNLLQAGVELYELDNVLNRKQRRARRGQEKGFTKSSLHAKSFVADRKLVFIGSLNLDPRSFFENTEIGVVLESKEIAADMAAWFEKETRHNAYTLTLKMTKKRPAPGTKKPAMLREVILWHKADRPDLIYRHEPKAGFWRRLGVGLLSILPIESQL